MSTRAQRLAAGLLIFGLVDEPPVDALAALESCPLLIAEEMEAWRDADEQDAALLRACLIVERELRAAQWAALAVLDLAMHGPEAQAERGGSCADSAGRNAARLCASRARRSRPDGALRARLASRGTGGVAIPGRRHIAKPGEAVCPNEDCSRPAGFATATPGKGPCLRHGGRARVDQRSQIRASAPAPTLGEHEEGCEDGRELASALPPRAVSAGEPVPDPFAALLSILALLRSAGFEFSSAWTLAAGTVLSHLSEREAQVLWEVLDGTRDGWHDAYVGRRSRLAELEVRHHASAARMPPDCRNRANDR